MIPTRSRQARSRQAKAVLALLAGLGAAPAAAQPSPLSVNDCTLLPDPGALRRCLDQAEGRVVAPLPPVAGPATSERPEQVVQAARGAPVAKPGALPGAKPGALPPTDFLGNRREPAPRAHPSGRTVIDLQ
ncbi:hypothetical protein ABC766_15385 [Methylobacterium fujisawaense]|uniref:hypothetical protein n=1 Tax=Methylobacterium fujisawaense TaxID=107400 RepID=UPI0031F5BFB9